jgi:hypothetical protein
MASFNNAFAAQLSRNEELRKLKAARRAAGPLIRGQYSAYRQNRGATVANAAYRGMGGLAAAKFGASYPDRASAARLTNMETHGKEYATRRNNRNQARVNIQIAINKLIGKPVATWNMGERAFYSQHRVRYQNAVNKTVKGGLGGLRGLARLREAGRGFGARMRNRLGMAGLDIRGGLAMGRYAGNLTAAAAARGYSKFAKGAGAAAKYGYRGAHAAGNYPRVYGAVGRAPNVATVRSAVKKMNEAALAARANPTRTNVKQANNAATRAARLMAQVNNQL